MVTLSTVSPRTPMAKLLSRPPMQECENENNTCQHAELRKLLDNAYVIWEKQATRRESECKLVLP